MVMTMRLDTLLALLTFRGCAMMKLPDGRSGYLDSIQREDGSGTSFNLKVVCGDEVVRVYCKCPRF